MPHGEVPGFGQEVKQEERGSLIQNLTGVSMGKTRQDE